MSASVTAPPAVSKRERLALEELLWRGVAADPLVFLAASRTLDEHAAPGTMALKPFPVCAVCATAGEWNERTRLVGVVPMQESLCLGHGRPHKPYFAPLTRTWQTESRVLMEKSRQLLISWWGVDVHTHMAMVRPGALVGFQSLNREKACELLNRAEIIYRALPRELQRFGPMSDAPKARARRTEDQITFVHDVDGRRVESRIKAIPNGPHHVRMYTFTAMLMDEAQFWEQDEDFEESYSAALATVTGGGKITAISSVNHAGTFHHKLCAGLI